jgi:ubiquinone biosynthesis protein
VFIKTVLIDGFFHADLHGGNFFLLENNKIAIIDFGLVGTLGKKDRLSFVSIIYSLITHNFENLVYEFLDVAEYEKIPEVDELIKDIRDSLSPFIGLTVKQTNLSRVFKRILTTLSKHQVYLPREWFIIFRALITLDGVGKSLNMDIDLLSLMQEEMGGIIKKSMSKEELVEEGVWLARDLLSSFRIVPRHLRWFIKDISKRGYSIDIKNVGQEEMVEKFSKALGHLSFSFMAGILLIAGCLVIETPRFGSFYSIPVLSYIFWFLSAALFTKVLIRK